MSANRVVEHLLGQQLLQSHIPLLDRLQPLGLGHLHPGILRSPRVERRRGDPCLRQTSAVFAPASCSFSIPMICSSVNREARIDRLLDRRTLPKSGERSGSQVRSIKSKKDGSLRIASMYVLRQRRISSSLTSPQAVKVETTSPVSARAATMAE